MLKYELFVVCNTYEANSDFDNILKTRSHEEAGTVIALVGC